MSRRYECGTAGQTELGILSGEEACEEEVLYAAQVQAGQHALIIGDPYASAYALTGTPAELLAFLDRARGLVGRLVVAAEADGLASSRRDPAAPADAAS